MAWETRGRCCFYRRSVRDGRRVKTVYYRTGEESRLAGLVFGERAARRLAVRSWLASSREKWQAACHQLAPLEQLVRYALDASLLSVGYYCHKRQWRWRGRVMSGVRPGDAGHEQGLEALVRRARGGDVTALPELRFALDADPSLWQRGLGLAATAEAAWLHLACGGDLAMREAAVRELATLKEDLAGPSPTALERLLVDRAAITWIQAQYADAIYAQLPATPEAIEGVRRELMARQESAHRRYLGALHQLAQTRALLARVETTSAPRLSVVGGTKSPKQKRA